MGTFELIKLVSLYKAHCKGLLTPIAVTEEILDTRLAIDNIYCKTGSRSEHLEKYISELEYLLFEIMQDSSEKL